MPAKRSPPLARSTMVGRIGFVSGFVVGVGFLVAMTWDLPWTVSRTLMVAGSGLLMGLLIGLAVWMMERFNYSK